jgi:hypothetical protein
MSFLDLKRNSASALTQLTDKLKEQRTSSFERDARYWQPVVSKEGNGIAVIRFLPAPEGEDLPFVQKFSHSFKGPGGWYIENSRTTINEKDPVAESNSKLWETEVESNRDIARKRKRKLGFVGNILVLKHTARPEDEGKVFLYGFGKKIFDKLNDKMNPSEETGETPFNPFDFWNGADFILKIKNVATFRNYDDSQFKAQSPLFDGDDAKLEAIYKQLYSLKAEIAPDKFKSYEELEKKFLRVIGETGSRVEPRQQAARKEEPEVSEDGIEEEDPASFFEKLANR